MAKEKKPDRRQAGDYTGRSKVRKRSPLFAPVAFVLICLSLILAMSVFFKVNEIRVEGNAIYTDEEIIEASGIDTGDNLFFINKIAVGSRIINRLPYVQVVEDISRILPDKVVITVTESNPIACVSAGTELWMIDRTGKLMGSITEAEAEGLIRVTGLEPIEPKVGEIIAPGTEDAPKVTYLKEILTEIEVRDLREKVTDLDITSVANPTFTYEGRFTVKLGSQEDTEKKFGILLSAVAQLTAGDTGTIDLSLAGENKAHFMPA